MGSIGTLSFVMIMSLIEIFAISQANWICYLLIGLIVAIIMFAHRKNIKRLFDGKENPTNIKGAFKKDVNKLKNKNK